jgi:hypothetical protein
MKTKAGIFPIDNFFWIDTPVFESNPALLNIRCKYVLSTYYLLVDSQVAQVGPLLRVPMRRCGPHTRS